MVWTWKGKTIENMGQTLDAITAVAKGGDKVEAKEFLRSYIDVIVKAERVGEVEARKIAKANIGYGAGYLSGDTAEKIHEVFNTEHPAFDRG